MVTTEKEIDYYKVLEASFDATLETIESLFRIKGQQLHEMPPSDQKNKEITLLVNAYKTLSNPQKRQEYDRIYSAKRQPAAPTSESDHRSEDYRIRKIVLSVLCAQRRKSIRVPGVGDSTLEQETGCTPEALNFQLWYMGEKGWLRREESGAITLTAAGVDQLEQILSSEQNNFTASR